MLSADRRVLRLDHRGDAGARRGEDAGYFDFGDFQEAAQYRGIELSATAGIQAPNSFVMIEPLPIAAIGNHGVECVYDRHNARAQWDFFGLEAAGISTP